MTLKAALRVDTWNDIVCPWCYVGEARLTRAATRVTDAEIVIVPHAFELDPGHAHPEGVVDMLARKYGTTSEQARAMDARVAAMAAAEGLPYTSDRVTANTFDAHRLIAAAVEVGASVELLHALQRGHFSGELDLEDADALVAAATDAGLGGARAREVLAGDEYAAAVRADESLARQLGATGVPYTVVGQRYAIPGCVDVDQYERVLRAALDA